MRHLYTSRLHRAVMLAIGCSLLMSAAPASHKTAAQPDKLVILSVTDVKGKTSPCGCHTPKGGLARQASFRDSMVAEYGNVMLVDNGGYFAEDDQHRGFPPFIQQQMVKIGFTCAGTGDRDLRHGLAFLRDNAKAAGLKQLSSNLYMKATNKPALMPSLITTVGGTKVGLFSLISDKVDLGPARDSLVVKDPTETAKQMVAELKKGGATVIVALSQLGKVESEDLANDVEGIDVVIAGRNVPLIQKGRVAKNTVICYGGEQGQYIGRTVLTLDAKHVATARDNETFMLSPDVGEDPVVLAAVKAFEADFNAEQAKVQKEEAAKAAAAPAAGQENPDRYVGMGVCQRCHVEEYEQWKTTNHAQAWKTLVDIKKDATPDCIPCHVVGYKQPGGFESGVMTPQLGNVQCESCHGMGTKHESFATTPAKVSADMCLKCHTDTTSPTFDFATYRPHIIHQPVANLQPLPQSPAQKMKMQQGSGGH